MHADRNRIHHPLPWLRIYLSFTMSHLVKHMLLLPCLQGGQGQQGCGPQKRVRAYSRFENIGGGGQQHPEQKVLNWPSKTSCFSHYQI